MLIKEDFVFNKDSVAISRVKLVNFLRQHHDTQFGPELLMIAVTEMLKKDVSTNEIERKMNCFFELFFDLFHNCGSNYNHVRLQHESWINGLLSFARDSSGTFESEEDLFPGIMSPKEAKAAGIENPSNFKLHSQLVLGNRNDPEVKKKLLESLILTREDFVFNKNNITIHNGKILEILDNAMDIGGCEILYENLSKVIGMEVTLEEMISKVMQFERALDKKASTCEDLFEFHEKYNPWLNEWMIFKRNYDPEDSDDMMTDSDQSEDEECALGRKLTMVEAFDLIKECKFNSKQYNSLREHLPILPFIEKDILSYATDNSKKKKNKM